MNQSINRACLHVLGLLVSGIPVARGRTATWNAEQGWTLRPRTLEGKILETMARSCHVLRGNTFVGICRSLAEVPVGTEFVPRLNRPSRTSLILECFEHCRVPTMVLRRNLAPGGEHDRIEGGRERKLYQ